MCGIVGYIGDKKAYPILIKGLSRLEYRGYDSAGVAILNSKNELNVFKRQGKVQDLVDFIGKSTTVGRIGIGHTRWATHGLPNDINAHPHVSEDGKISLVHNGIIENYAILKDELIRRGHSFNSETDTEVLVHLIEHIYTKGNVSLTEAVRLALNKVVGAYAIVVISSEEPNKVICAKKSSPLVIGIGIDEYYIASDATPFIEYTKNAKELYSLISMFGDTLEDYDESSNELSISTGVRYYFGESGFWTSFDYAIATISMDDSEDSYDDAEFPKRSAMNFKAGYAISLNDYVSLNPVIGYNVTTQTTKDKGEDKDGDEVDEVIKSGALGVGVSLIVHLGY